MDLLRCDQSGRVLYKSEQMKKLINYLPKWYDLIQKAISFNKEETFRTLRHIFRSLCVYFKIINNEFKINISTTNLNQLRKQLEKIKCYNEDIFILLLLFHDIGRPFNRIWHTYKSAEICKDEGLFETYELSEPQKKELVIVIKHHLMIGTIFTGESSFFGAIELFRDIHSEFENLTHSNLEIIFDMLHAFTLIDIWGYDYSKIYNHYFDYYRKIKENLLKISHKLVKSNFEGRIINLKSHLDSLDNKNLKWRIACCLRIFQFINTQPYLTEDFFFNKLNDGLNRINSSWERFEENLSPIHSIIQLKYALPLLMVIAVNDFKREPIRSDEELNEGIFKFWNNICRMVNAHILEIEKNSTKPIYIMFNLPYRWFFQKDYLNYILSNKFYNSLNNCSFTDKSQYNYNILNFRIKI